MARRTKAKSDSWPTVLTAVVAALSLLGNTIQAVYTINLTHRLNDSVIAKQDAELKLTQIETLSKKQDISVDLQTRYLISGPRGLINIRDLKPVVQNAVYRDLNAWLEQQVRKNKVNDLLSDKGADLNGRQGIVVLQVTNRGKITAKSVVLSMRAKIYHQDGESDDNNPVWKLDIKNWQSLPVSLRDMNPGESRFIPLAHIRGTRFFYGHVIMPERLDYMNAVTDIKETNSAPAMAPEDQWLAGGLNEWIYGAF